MAWGNLCACSLLRNMSVQYILHDKKILKIEFLCMKLHASSYIYVPNIEKDQFVKPS